MFSRSLIDCFYGCDKAGIISKLITVSDSSGVFCFHNQDYNEGNNKN